MVLNTTKTNEVTVDFRRSRRTIQARLLIKVKEVGRVGSIRFLGTVITKDLGQCIPPAWRREASKGNCFLRKLKQAGLPSGLLIHFYRSTIESILSQSCAAWYASCTAENRKDLSRVVKTAQRILL